MRLYYELLQKMDYRNPARLALPSKRELRGKDGKGELALLRFLARRYFSFTIQ
jgi:hypothetical protein